LDLSWSDLAGVVVQGCIGAVLGLAGWLAGWDAAALAADYGSAEGLDGAELVILDGAVRGARFNGRAGMEAYWDAVFAFLDPPID